MNKHIIIEGENGTGKTTIINKLCQKYTNLKYHHFGFPQGKTNEEKYFYQKGQFEMMFSLLENIDDRFIFDRSHIGELYWSIKYRKMNADYINELESKYKHIPMIVINICCKPELIHERLTMRNEKVPSIEEISYNQLSISRLCQKSVFPCYMIDTTDIKIDDTINQIEKILEKANEK